MNKLGSSDVANNQPLDGFHVFDMGLKSHDCLNTLEEAVDLVNHLVIDEGHKPSDIHIIKGMKLSPHIQIGI